MQIMTVRRIAQASQAGGKINVSLGSRPCENSEAQRNHGMIFLRIAIKVLKKSSARSILIDVRRMILFVFELSEFSHSLGHNPNPSLGAARPVPPGADMARASSPLVEPEPFCLDAAVGRRNRSNVLLSLIWRCAAD